jgi:putative ABC transport system permease protein
VAVISSVFAVWAMFTSFVRIPAGVSFDTILLFTAGAAMLIILVEWIYIHIVERASNREIQGLQVYEQG